MIGCLKVIYLHFLDCTPPCTLRALENLYFYCRGNMAFIWACFTRYSSILLPKYTLITAAGICSFASAWHAVREVAPAYFFSNLVWQPNACPKMSICLLRAFQGKLLIRDFLYSLGIIQDRASVLCLSATEDISHLFFSCQYSAYIWPLCKLKLGLSTVQHLSLEEGMSYYISEIQR